MNELARRVAIHRRWWLVTAIVVILGTAAFVPQFVASGVTKRQLVAVHLGHMTPVRVTVNMALTDPGLVLIVIGGFLAFERRSVVKSRADASLSGDDASKG